MNKETLQIIQDLIKNDKDLLILCEGIQQINLLNERIKILEEKLIEGKHERS